MQNALVAANVDTTYKLATCLNTTEVAKFEVAKLSASVYQGKEISTGLGISAGPFDP